METRALSVKHSRHLGNDKVWDSVTLWLEDLHFFLLSVINGDPATWDETCMMRRHAS